MAWQRTVPGLIAAIAFAHLSLASDAAAQQKPDKITIGYLNLVNAQLVTKALALHEKEMGVPIEWVKFGSGGDVNRGVAASQLAFGGVGNPPATLGVGRGLAYKGIFVLNMLGPVESLVVRTSKNIEKPQDLIGKTMAAPFGSTTHYLTIAYLRAAGVDPNSVKLLDMAPSDAVAAWLRGDIDAAYVWEPSLNKMVASGGKILMDSATMAKQGYPTWDVAVVMDDVAAKYPDLVAKFVKSECAGVDYWLKKPDETAAIIAKELSLPLEDATRMMQGTTMVPCSQQLSADYLGSSQAKGKFVDTLISTATFLTDQKRLPKVEARATYEDFVQPKFLEAAIGK
jgi:taurine transport system substrate-binding protein